MAHPKQIDFCIRVKNTFPDKFKNAIVLDVGSLDINGNNRYLFENSSYIGIDLGIGKNVDIVCKAHEFKSITKFSVIVSTECFEHDKYIEKTLINIVDLLEKDGIFLFTCAGKTRREHGTTLHSPEDSPFTSHIDDWESYFYGLNETDIRRMINVENIFSKFYFENCRGTQDFNFYGIKK